MAKYITVPHTCAVDNLRFRIRYGDEPGAACEWFDGLWADMRTRCDKAVRYPRSLRLGTYRELFKFDAGDSAVVVAMGRNGKGAKEELREGFLEFNPAKVYPSQDLRFLYERIGAEPKAKMELVRWDIAVDYPIEREGLALIRDARKYGAQYSESLTEYSGRRNSGGFVKVYDKRAERAAAGHDVGCEPLTRVEVTIEEPRESLGKWWPRVVWLPEDVGGITGSGVDDAVLRVLVLALRAGVCSEVALAGFSKTQKKRYRNALAGLVGQLAPPDEYGACRSHALAWERFYGGGELA